MLTIRACPFAGRVRAVFVEPVACNLMADRDGPSDETLSSEERGRWAVSRMNIVKRTQLRQTWIAVSLIAAVP